MRHPHLWAAIVVISVLGAKHIDPGWRELSVNEFGVLTAIESALGLAWVALVGVMLLAIVVSGGTRGGFIENQRFPTSWREAAGFDYGGFLIVPILTGLLALATYYSSPTVWGRYEAMLASHFPLAAWGLSSAVFARDALCMIVVAPIAEELFFRSLLYSGFKKRWGTGLAVALSTVVFALCHQAIADGPNYHLLVIHTLSGLYLCWIYVFRGLAGAVCAHCAINATIIVLGLLSTW